MLTGILLAMGNGRHRAIRTGTAESECVSIGAGYLGCYDGWQSEGYSHQTNHAKCKTAKVGYSSCYSNWQGQGYSHGTSHDKCIGL